MRVNVLVPGTIATDMVLPVDPVKREAFIEDMSKQNVFAADRSTRRSRRRGDLPRERPRRSS